MSNLNDRESLFKNEVDQFQDYDQKLRESFFDYWSEPNKSKTKMRFELEKTWDIKRRLKTFYNNQIKWSKNASSSTHHGKDAGAHQLLEELRANFKPE